MKTWNITAFFAFAIILISPIRINGQQTKILTGEKHNEYGLIYTLPVTAFEVKVTAEKETRKAGEFFKYARKYVGTENVVKENREIWTIKSVEVIPYGIPNPDSKYLMQLKAGSPTFIGVAEDNMLLSINIEPDNPRTVPTSIEEKKEVTIELGDKEYLKYVSDDFMVAQSSAKQAQILYDELMEIRDAKISLTRGTAETMPTDGRQLEIMLGSLERQEAALTAAFTGETKTETFVRSYSFVPSGDSEEILFRFSDFAGFVDADDYSGDPVKVNVKVTDRGELPLDGKGEEKKFPKDGVAYCIPGAASISIVSQGNLLYSKEFEIAQFGVVFGLNPSIFTDKKEPSYAIFDPATGALKELATMRE